MADHLPKGLKAPPQERVTLQKADPAQMVDPGLLGNLHPQRHLLDTAILRSLLQISLEVSRALYFYTLSFLKSLLLPPGFPRNPQRPVQALN